MMHILATILKHTGNVGLIQFRQTYVIHDTFSHLPAQNTSLSKCKVGSFNSQSPNQMISLILLFGFLCRSYSQIQVTEKYSTAMCYFLTWIGLNLVQRSKRRLHQLKRTKFALMPPIRRSICHIFYLFSIREGVQKKNRKNCAFLTKPPQGVSINFKT